MRVALESGALAEFGHKYRDVVIVYTINAPAAGSSLARSAVGQHVRRTSETRRAFEIIVKEASAGAGVRWVNVVLNGSCPSKD
jgi:alanyl-tRNA synthetase